MIKSEPHVQDNMNNGGPPPPLMSLNRNSDLYVRVRGLPFSASAEDIVKFFDDVDLLGGTSAVTFTYTKEGRPSGEAYIAVPTKHDLDVALKHNKMHMQSRYVEVFASNRDEMEYVVRKSGPNPNSGNDAVLRLRGLPFGCSKEEVAQFFSGYEIVPNGITLTTDMQGRTAGDAYVQFTMQDVAEKACTEKNMQRIGHRYIELFHSTAMEARSAGAGGLGRNSRAMRPAPYDRHDRYSAGGGGYGGPDRYSSSSGGYGSRGGRHMRSYHEDYDDGYSRGYERGSRGGRRGGGMGSMRSGGGGGVPGSDHRSTTGHSVHMRGLPFSAEQLDIVKFFAPLSPVEITLGYTHDNRKSGEADVDFMTHEEACEAMKRDKSNMEHRYIELFLNSKSGGRGDNRSDVITHRSMYRGAAPAPMGRMSGGGAMTGGSVSHSMDPRGGPPNRGMVTGGGELFPTKERDFNSPYNYSRPQPAHGGGGYGGGFSNQQMPGGNNGFQSFS